MHAGNVGTGDSLCPSLPWVENRYPTVHSQRAYELFTRKTQKGQQWISSSR